MSYLYLLLKIIRIRPETKPGALMTINFIVIPFLS